MLNNLKLIKINKNITNENIPEFPGSSSASGLGGTSESDNIIQSSESDDDEDDSSPLLLSTISTTCKVNEHKLFLNIFIKNIGVNK